MVVLLGDMTASNGFTEEPRKQLAGLSSPRGTTPPMASSSTEPTKIDTSIAVVGCRIGAAVVFVSEMYKSIKTCDVHPATVEVNNAAVELLR
ncbi:hypothetical protein MUCCIDRAFT_107054 [Mucor lusitanicus CBS 277.49]|uniref:Uncharacterized protein n=1 Tax=Mucor lusitanicus CBS 277.49 TaxID=747725 RepID=A0A162ZJ63_MUCCL|nr:hypothetical protein MUCCIDRAFT_107054 [Mucor lusitanicus CBS 277.49]